MPGINSGTECSSPPREAVATAGVGNLIKKKEKAKPKGVIGGSYGTP